MTFLGGSRLGNGSPEPLGTEHNTKWYRGRQHRTRLPVDGEGSCVVQAPKSTKKGVIFRWLASEHINVQGGYALQRTLQLFCAKRPAEIAGSTPREDNDKRLRMTRPREVGQRTS